MRAVRITRFGGPEVLDVVHLSEPEPGEGQQLFDVATAGIDYADTHHVLSQESPLAAAWLRSPSRASCPSGRHPEP